jgi:catechol 2,3-dioxygenase-like lactoylglutathione lyase family enzyme
VLLAADVVISELMAKNKATLQDNFGDYSDWLELHNTGDATADLSSWYLTDTTKNLTEWQFPSGTTLAAGGFLVVFASGRDIAVAGQPFHTNFKLDDGGEYLALVQPDGATIQYQYTPTFPVQTADISYGMVDDDDPSSALQYFSTPTPGAANEPSAVAVTFSQPGGGYASSIAVNLSSTTLNAQIRYTTDGTVPTSSSTLYTGPITVARDTMLRARAYATSYTASPISSQQYFILDSSVASFHSNLPLVVLDTFGNSVGQSSQTPVSAMVFSAPTDGSDTTLTQTPEFVGRAGLNVRGQTSTSFPKLQYHFEIWDESNNDRNASLLGMPADSDWVLYAPYSEKSLMQNQLAYMWSNEIGEYAVRTQWVEVFLNSSGGAQVDYSQDYVGVYLLEEKIKIAPDRVDITKVGPGDDTVPSITGGYIWHKDKPDPDDPSFTTESGQTFLYEDPDADKLDDTQKAWLTSYINQFETALYGPNFTDPNVGYAHYIDVQSFVDNWILVEMCKNIDGFRLSTYYYKDENGLIHMGPIWDYNLSMGNANYNGGDSPTGWYHDEISAQDYTYFDRLTQDPKFMQLVSQRWQQLRDSVFSTQQIVADINANVQLLTDGNGNVPVGTFPTQTPNNPVVRNFEKWNILGTNVWPNSYVGNSWMDEVNYLQNFMTTRVAWMDTQLDPLDPASSPGAPQSLVATMVSGVQVNLAWVPADPLASEFEIDQSADGGATWMPIALTQGTNYSYLVGGLSPGKTYSFRIVASNVLGTSAPSKAASATTGTIAPLLNMSTGFSGAGASITMNGGAALSGSSLQLTNATGNMATSTFSTNVVEALRFNTVFTFQLTNASADGFTFTLQNDGRTAVGASGGSLGYYGLAKSVAIKFDLYNNSGEGTDSTGLFVNGAQPMSTTGQTSNVSLDMTASGVNLHSGDTFLTTLQYDGTALLETVVDTNTGAQFSHSYTINIPSFLVGNTAYVGFTAGTGGSSAIQDILNWTYTPVPPPAPAGLAASAGIGQVALNWTASSQPGTLYNVYRGTMPGGESAVAIATGLSAAYFTDIKATNGVAWYYTVTAVDAAGESAASLEAAATPLAAPRITAVYVGSNKWTAPFLNNLAAQGLGSTTYGFAIQTGKNQTASLPWVNLDEVSVTFDQPLTAAAVQQATVALHGVNVANYALSSPVLSSDKRTITWTLANPIGADRLQLHLSGLANANGTLLDGAWTNGSSAFPSGNGTPGSSFAFTFNVLPGDVNRDGYVLITDYNAARAYVNFVAGSPNYNAFIDLTGTGYDLITDANIVRALVNQEYLPNGLPA